ncbi:MAG: hypothetical protein KME27_28520 [Lyngbya sp. HA4199-MV5]|nr:hypothetical protein [Lyngbya sp. HA4199-MV5]
MQRPLYMYNNFNLQPFSFAVPHPTPYTPHPFEQDCSLLDANCCSTIAPSSPRSKYGDGTPDGNKN